jgi:putative transcriptional regulator
MSKSAFDNIAAGLKDALAHTRGDTAKARVTVVNVLDVREIRRKLGMSQTEFASTFRVSVGTVRNWEQGRRAPRGAARVLLSVIDREPDAVRRALDAA